MKPVFRQNRLIRCVYKSLRCLHLEIWRLFAHYDNDDNDDDTTNYFTLCACARGNYCQFATTYTSNSNSEFLIQSPVKKPGKTYHMCDIRCNRLPYRAHTCAGSCYNGQGARDWRSYSLISIFSTAGKIWVPWDEATQASIPNTLHAIARDGIRMCPYMEVHSSRYHARDKFSRGVRNERNLVHLPQKSSEITGNQ